MRVWLENIFIMPIEVTTLHTLIRGQREQSILLIFLPLLATYVQGRAKKKMLSCEKVLPGSAWLVLIKTGPFSAQACSLRTTYILDIPPSAS